jgi:hypothetical protein
MRPHYLLSKLMSEQSHKNITDVLDAVIPVSRVLDATRTFLTRCGWRLEIDEYSVTIPSDVELEVRSRAFVKADNHEVFLDDHFEAVVLLGKEAFGTSYRAAYGVLCLYFNQEGQFVSEDRYNRYH